VRSELKPEVVLDKAHRAVIFTIVQLSCLFAATVNYGNVTSDFTRKLARSFVKAVCGGVSNESAIGVVVREKLGLLFSSS